MQKPLICLSLLLLQHAAQAVEYTQLQSDKSQLSFQFKQMNVPMDGSFKRFKGQLKFDPAQTAQSSASFEVDISSVDVGASEYNEELAGKLWFNTKAFPTAKFTSQSIKALGNNRFEVSGTLNIKGRTQTINTTATLREEGKLGIFEGKLPLKRADYAIGEGIWADFGTVANEVQLQFRLAANAAPAAASGKK